MALIPSLTSDEVEANERRKQELVALIASGDAVLFVGAGSSKMAGFPTWAELILKLEQLAAECGDGFDTDQDIFKKGPTEFLAYLSKIKTHIRDRMGNDDTYNTFLTRTFSGESGFTVLEMHHQLVRLPFRGIVTTNYDFVLEAALARDFRDSGHNNSLAYGIDAPYLIYELLRKLTIAGQQRQVLHIHGCYRAPDRIVLTLEDYEVAYGDDSYLPDVMRTVLSSYRLVFVGFSLTDPYFRGLLGRVVSRFQLKALPIHFAVVDISPLNAPEQKARAHQLKLEYGTEVVFYDRIDDTHRGLRDIIGDIARAVLPDDRRLDAVNDTVAAEIVL